MSAKLRLFLALVLIVSGCGLARRAQMKKVISQIETTCRQSPKKLDQVECLHRLDRQLAIKEGASQYAMEQIDLYFTRAAVIAERLDNGQITRTEARAKFAVLKAEWGAMQRANQAATIAEIRSSMVCMAN